MVALSNQIVGQSLVLECDVTTVMGITSGVEIVWSEDDSEVQRVSRANSTMYRDLYNIALLGTADDGRLYKCEAVINTNPSVISNNDITLNVNGKSYIKIMDKLFTLKLCGMQFLLPLSL